MTARLRVVACGAIAPELKSVFAQIGVEVVIDPLPAPLHNTPDRITAAVLERIEANPDDRILVGYADCGTGGLLDAALEPLGIERIPGAHCYEFFAGSAAFAALADEEPGTFYLTDFLARNFDALVWRGLGLDRHPTLRDTYFANYERLVLLTQGTRTDHTEDGRRAAEMLGLTFAHHHTGLEPVTVTIRRMVAA